MSSRFAGRRVFVTGGTSGIGEAVARRFLREGADVLVCGRDKAKMAGALQRLGRAASGTASRCEGITLDVADAAAVERAVPEIIARLGGVDTLVNNAGITHPAEATNTTLKQYRAIMDTNYFGAVHVTKALLPSMLAARRGHIAAVLSVAGFMGVYGYTAYAASKYALHGFFDSLRQELVGSGVDLSLLFPGDTDTPQLAAENLIKPEGTRAVAGNVPVLSPDVVAGALVEGMAERRYHIVPGLHAKLAYYAQRHAPGVVRAALDRDLKKLSKP